ncbi:MAG: hypothetical protein F4101_06340, partial [Nitrospira sp. SB0673_bin_12]|nr:hypothetical protein [Nitrospira sp. SB0673_bin_12]
MDFTLTPTDDALPEDDETISIAGTLTGVTVTGTTLTLTSDDAAPTALTLTVDADTGTAGVQDRLAEAGGVKTVRVTATLGDGATFAEAKTVTVQVGAAADSATEGTDYTEVPDQSLTIAANTASAFVDFTLTPTDDAFHEGSETISVEGTLVGIMVTGATITIADNDAAPSGFTLMATPDSVGEEDGATTVTVTATVNGATRYADAQTLTVRVADGTATAPADYASVAAFTLTLAAGEARGTGQFTLTPVDDVQDEPDETIQITATAGALTLTPATVTLEDNDDISIMSITGGTADEGAAVGFTVTRTGGTESAATVQWGTAADTTGAFPATAADYTPVPQPQALHFAPGETRKRLEVSTTDDAMDEEDETFVVRLSGGSAQVVIAADGGVATGTILDNDAPPELLIDDVTVEEGEPAHFPVTLSAVSGKSIRVAWHTVEGTATEAQDYTGQHGQVTIPPGVRTTDLVVPTIDDSEVEAPEERYTLRLFDPQAVVLGRGEVSRAAAGPGGGPAVPAEEMIATGFILDNDLARLRAQIKQVNEALLPWVGSALLRRHLDRITGCLQETGTAGPDLGAMVERAVRYAEAQQTAQQSGGRQASLWETLGNTRLAGSLGPAAPESEQRPVTLCVGTNWRRLTNDGPVSWEGTLLGANLNGHVQLSEQWRVGLDVAHDQGRLTWQLPSDGDAGDWDLALTGVRPYVAWQTSGGVQAWGLVG